MPGSVAPFKIKPPFLIGANLTYTYVILESDYKRANFKLLRNMAISALILNF